MRSSWAINRLLPTTLLALAFLSTPGSATTLVVPSDDQMIVSARAIVRGNVVGIYSGVDDSTNLVYTYVTLRVKEVLKGQITAREIVIKEPGGETATRGSIVYGTPQFTVSERVLVYLASWPDGSFCVDNMLLGKFSLSDDPNTGETFVARETAGGHVETLRGSGFGLATDRMELSRYRRLIQQSLQINRDRSAAFEKQYYGHVPMLLKPLEYEARRSSGALQPQFRLLFNARWFQSDDGQPVNVLVNPESPPTPSLIEDVAAACEAWSSVPGSALRLQGNSTTEECRNNGSITVTTGPLCWPLPITSGFLAFSGLDWDPSTRKTINSVSFAKATVGFVSLHPNAGLNTSCDLRLVVTHEMGHALGLHHSWQPGFDFAPSAADIDATMYYIAHFDGRCAQLREDDHNGARFIYPGTGAGPSGPTITTAALPIGVVGVPYSQTLNATGGVPPYLWSLAPGSNPLPSGFSLSPTGVLAATPAGVGTTVVKIRVVETSGRFADKDFSITVANPGSPFNSMIVSQSVPASIGSGQAFNVSFTWRNSGVEPWSAGSGVRIGSQNPPNNTFWGGNLIQIPGGSLISPGQQLAITFTVFAPITPGTYNLQFQLQKDGSGFFGEPSTNAVVKVSPGTSLTLAAPSSVEAVVGLAFSLQVSAAGGVPPYTWAVMSGALPVGLGLDPSSGMISGAPLTAGTNALTIKATDAEGRTGEKPLEIIVRPPPVFVITTLLPTAVKDSSYTQQLSATGGIQPYQWSIGDGALAAGLTLEQASGRIVGTPTATGSFAVTVTVRDSSGGSANRLLSLLVVGPDAVPHVNKAKYKAGAQKLIIAGDQFSPAAVVLVDDSEVTPKSKESTSIVVKPVALGPGTHTVRIVNPFGVSSTLVTFTVQ